MIKQSAKDLSAISCFNNPYLKKLFKDYLSYLSSKGYATHTVQFYLGSIKHFVNWVGPNKITKLSITEKTIDKFVDKHLPTCTCLPPNDRNVKRARSALNIMLKVAGVNRICKT